MLRAIGKPYIADRAGQVMHYIAQSNHSACIADRRVFIKQVIDAGTVLRKPGVARDRISKLSPQQKERW
jgi:hypothetical protein